MKPDKLDNGMDSVVAYHLHVLRHTPDTGQELDEYLQAIAALLRRADALLPTLGFAECAEAIDPRAIAATFKDMEYYASEQDDD